ncbi:hypothetical protein PHYSODRAFT_530620 [Phytophthora sojae]|uniref:Exodeoxyribonuclease X-like C-terminal domain-containing protein n=1 Tax=Phytophthora sojae (strain P6497) TaxID=1094619 RepID=G5ACT2_PHYSP|nr:hypothetical protein PHYSODRAFT_530620 [Phytophthora sojae]EGZ07156.1 hypothetical protein PHYSODRAFT_530620 [Phytophthora sojae]|eukprot:XP_009537920.1 hypothetical protein PHYSODRAFT_530620 [Phytophthora sojae]
MSVILEFGRYSGRSIRSVYNYDRAYCRWLASKNIFSEDSPIGKYLQLKFG